MLKLDHLTVIAPSLAEGVEHVRDCLRLDVPFGGLHTYMGTHNHRLQLGNSTYLEIVALDPDGFEPRHARWFGVDDHRQVRADWADGRRLRGWVANVQAIGPVLSEHVAVLAGRSCFRLRPRHLRSPYHRTERCLSTERPHRSSTTMAIQAISPPSPI